jgi:hypothetical protein
MADYADFDQTLQPWLKAVWEKRLAILHAGNKAREAVYALYSAADVVDKTSNVTLLRGIYQGKAEASGFRLKDQIDPDTKVVGYYHFERVKPSLEPKAYRIYLNFQPAEKLRGASPRTALLEAILSKAKTEKGIAKLKMAVPNQPARKDKFVIWLHDESAVKRVLKEMEADFTKHCSGDTPPGVKAVSPGVGWACEPPETAPEDEVSQESGSTIHSFGTYLTSIICLALRSCEQQAKATDAQPGDFLGKLLALFTKFGINPKAPHLLGKTETESEAMSKELDHRVTMANSTLVRAPEIIGQNVLVDTRFGTNATKPFSGANSNNE